MHWVTTYTIISLVDCRVVHAGNAGASATVCDGVVAGAVAGIPCIAGINGGCGAAAVHDPLDGGRAAAELTKSAHLF